MGRESQLDKHFTMGIIMEGKMSWPRLRTKGLINAKPNLTHVSVPWKVKNVLCLKNKTKKMHKTQTLVGDIQQVF